LDRAVDFIVAAAFETKFYLLFSFLFGCSFTLQLARGLAQQREFPVAVRAAAGRVDADRPGPRAAAVRGRHPAPLGSETPDVMLRPGGIRESSHPGDPGAERARRPSSHQAQP
jgi:hypothetical protein